MKTDNPDGAPAVIQNIRVAPVFAGLVQAMLSSTPLEDKLAARYGCEYMDGAFDADDLAPETRAYLFGAIHVFLHVASPWLKPEHDKHYGRHEGEGPELAHYNRIGHDLWLTAAYHGAGFWDGDWQHGDLLTEKVRHTFGYPHGVEGPYVGDDSKLYIL